ncbi:MAG: IS630 family transposase [Nocardioidaceae bacterium]
MRAGLVQRAKIVLLAADGVANQRIMEQVGVARPTVTKWRARYEAEGIEGLADADRPGRPATVDQARIIAATLRKPPKKLGVTHWSSRLLGRHLGLHHSVVAAAWKSYGVQPRREETFKFSTDPELEAKVIDVVGLYLAPPEDAVVLCIDELGRAGARHRSCERYVSPARPPNPACVSPRTGLSANSYE